MRGCVGLRLLLSLHPLPPSLMHSAASAEKGLESAAVQKHPSRHEPSTGRLVARSDCGNRETRGPRVAMGFLGGNDLECEKPYRNHATGRASRAPTRIAAAAQRGLRMAAQVTDQRLKSDTIVKCDSIPFSRMDWPPYPTPSPSHMHPPHTWHPVPVLASHIPLSHMQLDRILVCEVGTASGRYP